MKPSVSRLKTMHELELARHQVTALIGSSFSFDVFLRRVRTISYTDHSMSDDGSTTSRTTSGPTPEALARTLARHPRPLGGDTQRATGTSKLDL
ncbi:MAG: hypothetical protein RIR10_1043, partial [Planctomycetota bacterium]